MTETATTASTEQPASAPAVRLPPGPRIARSLQGFVFALFRRPMTEMLVDRYGPAVTVSLPVFGPTVIVADPQLAKQLFTASTDDVGNIQPNLSRVLGPGSVFALDRAEHRRRRKLLTPPFHGKSIKNYERIFEEETLREAASWPVGQEFPTLEPMMRITLNAILRAVFGADGAHLDELRQIIPPWVTLGSRVATMPSPKRDYGRWSPWGRLAEYRRRYDEVVGRLIDEVRTDPRLGERDDVLALLLRSTYEDGTAMSRQDVADELLTLLAAGHETTASTLAWVFERVSRHPQVLARLVDEADKGGASEATGNERGASEATGDHGANEYRQAVILETQRVRTVIDFAGRHVYSPTFELGEWVVPQGYSIMVSLSQLHRREFAAADRFDPERLMGTRPPLAWVPYGGGTRRCVGAVFANVEMDIVLRTVLRHFTLTTTTAPGEKVHSRGVAFTPKRGGRVTLARR